MGAVQVIQTVWEIADFYIAAFYADLDARNTTKASPRLWKRTVKLVMRLRAAASTTPISTGLRGESIRRLR